MLTNADGKQSTNSLIELNLIPCLDPTHILQAFILENNEQVFRSCNFFAMKKECEQRREKNPEKTIHVVQANKHPKADIWVTHSDMILPKQDIELKLQYMSIAMAFEWQRGEGSIAVIENMLRNVLKIWPKADAIDMECRYKISEIIIMLHETFILAIADKQNVLRELEKQKKIMLEQNQKQLM